MKSDAIFMKLHTRLQSTDFVVVLVFPESSSSSVVVLDVSGAGGERGEGRRNRGGRGLWRRSAGVAATRARGQA